MRFVSTQARSAAAMSRARSCVSQVKPSPSVLISTCSGKRCRKFASPVSHAPLMNCTMPTRMPCPRHRITIPNADEDFPFPFPVWTISNPFCAVFPSIIRSRAALILAIFSACTRASGSRLRVRLKGEPRRTRWEAEVAERCS
jgi:hypothetical protein